MKKQTSNSQFKIGKRLNLRSEFGRAWIYTPPSEFVVAFSLLLTALAIEMKLLSVNELWQQVLGHSVAILLFYISLPKALLVPFSNFLVGSRINEGRKSIIQLFNSIFPVGYASAFSKAIDRSIQEIKFPCRVDWHAKLIIVPIPRQLKLTTDHDRKNAFFIILQSIHSAPPKPIIILTVDKDSDLELFRKDNSSSKLLKAVKDKLERGAFPLPLCASIELSLHSREEIRRQGGATYWR